MALMLSERNRARCFGRVGCKCCDSNMYPTTNRRRALRRRIRRIDKQAIRENR